MNKPMIILLIALLLFTVFCCSAKSTTIYGDLLLRYENEFNQQTAPHRSFGSTLSDRSMACH